MLFHLVQRQNKKLFGLSTLGDEDIIGIGLGNGLGSVFFRQLRVGLNIDNLQGDQIGSFDGGLECILRLLGAIGA